MFYFLQSSLILTQFKRFFGMYDLHFFIMEFFWLQKPGTWFLTLTTAHHMKENSFPSVRTMSAGNLQSFL